MNPLSIILVFTFVAIITYFYYNNHSKRKLGMKCTIGSMECGPVEDGILCLCSGKHSGTCGSHMFPIGVSWYKGSEVSKDTVNCPDECAEKARARGEEHWTLDTTDMTCHIYTYNEDVKKCKVKKQGAISSHNIREVNECCKLPIVDSVALCNDKNVKCNNGSDCIYHPYWKYKCKTNDCSHHNDCFANCQGSEHASCYLNEPNGALRGCSKDGKCIEVINKVSTTECEPYNTFDDPDPDDPDSYNDRKEACSDGDASLMIPCYHGDSKEPVGKCRNLPDSDKSGGPPFFVCTGNVCTSDEYNTNDSNSFFTNVNDPYGHCEENKTNNSYIDWKTLKHCNNQDDCTPAQYCDNNTKTCIGITCKTDSDCKKPNQICDDKEFICTENMCKCTCELVTNVGNMCVFDKPTINTAIPDGMIPVVNQTECKTNTSDYGCRIIDNNCQCKFVTA